MELVTSKTAFFFKKKLYQYKWREKFLRSWNMLSWSFDCEWGGVPRVILGMSFFLSIPLLMLIHSLGWWMRILCDQEKTFYKAFSPLCIFEHSFLKQRSCTYNTHWSDVKYQSFWCLHSPRDRKPLWFLLIAVTWVLQMNEGKY